MKINSELLDNLASDILFLEEKKNSDINTFTLYFIRELNRKIFEATNQKFFIKINGTFVAAPETTNRNERKNIKQFSVYFVGHVGCKEIVHLENKEEDFLFPTTGQIYFMESGESSFLPYDNNIFLQNIKRDKPSWRLLDLIKKYVNDKTIYIVWPELKTHFQKPNVFIEIFIGDDEFAYFIEDKKNCNEIIIQELKKIGFVKEGKD